MDRLILVRFIMKQNYPTVMESKFGQMVSNTKDFSLTEYLMGKVDLLSQMVMSTQETMSTENNKVKEHLKSLMAKYIKVSGEMTVLMVKEKKDGLMELFILANIWWVLKKVKAFSNGLKMGILTKETFKTT